MALLIVWLTVTRTLGLVLFWRDWLSSTLFWRSWRLYSTICRTPISFTSKQLGNQNRWYPTHLVTLSLQTYSDPRLCCWLYLQWKDYVSRWTSSPDLPSRQKHPQKVDQSSQIFRVSADSSSTTSESFFMEAHGFISPANSDNLCMFNLWLLIYLLLSDHLTLARRTCCLLDIVQKGPRHRRRTLHDSHKFCLLRRHQLIQNILPVP
jgi:hypothetical protein